MPLPDLCPVQGGLLPFAVVKCCFKSGLCLLVLQERPRAFDMHSLESSLIDIMRAENDSIKGNFLNVTL